jgi:hypothetical protein
MQPSLGELFGPNPFASIGNLFGPAPTVPANASQGEPCCLMNVPNSCVDKNGNLSMGHTSTVKCTWFQQAVPKFNLNVMGHTDIWVLE